MYTIGPLVLEFAQQLRDMPVSLNRRSLGNVLQNLQLLR